MSNLTLQLDADALREATVQAMLGVLTPEVREKMLESAMQAILRPSTNSWERHKSPLELAFDRAVEQLARDEAKRLVDGDENLRGRLKALLKVTVEKVLDTDTDKMAQRMADAFVDSIRKD